MSSNKEGQVILVKVLFLSLILLAAPAVACDSLGFNSYGVHAINVGYGHGNAFVLRNNFGHRNQVVFQNRQRFHGGRQQVIIQNRSIVGDVLDGVFGRQRVIVVH